MKCFEIVTTMVETSKKKSYDFKFKQVVIQYAEKNNNRKAATARSIQGRLLFEGGFYKQFCVTSAASIQGRLLFEGGFHKQFFVTGAASIQGWFLFKKIRYISLVKMLWISA